MKPKLFAFATLLLLSTSLHAFQNQLLISVSDLPKHMNFSSRYGLNLKLSKVEVSLDNKIQKSVPVHGDEVSIPISFSELRRAYGRGTHCLEHVKITYFYQGFGQIAEYDLSGIPHKNKRLTVEAAPMFRVGLLGIATPQRLAFKYSS